MKLYYIVLLCMICTVNCIIGMEIAPQLSLCTLPEVLITRIAARSEQSDKQALCLVNKQLSVIASEKNIDNLLMHPCVLSRNYHRDCLIKYAVAKNEEMMDWALQSDLLCNHVDAVAIACLFIPPNDSSFYDFLLAGQQVKNQITKNQVTNDACSNLKDKFRIFLPTLMAVYRGDPSAYCVYKNNYVKAERIKKYSILQVAAYSNHLSVAELLLAQEKQGIVDFHTNKADRFAFTPLHFAVFYGHLDMTKLLCEHPKTDINAVDKYGCTALMYAVSPNKTEKTVKIAIVELLLQHEASLSITNLEGKSVDSFVSCVEIQQLLNAARMRIIYDQLSNKWEELKGSIADWF
jgi:ankyrin repeat protein